MTAIDEGAVRAGLRVSVVAVIWTVATGVLSIGIGAGRGSLALVAFGSIGMLDALGSATLVVHFRHTLHHEAFSERHERLALRVINLGMFVIGLSTVIESTRRLVFGAHVDTVWAGVVLAAVSVVVLAVLSVQKRRIGHQIPSRALQADGALSAIGAMLAFVTTVGAGIASFVDASSVDPSAAVVVGLIAVVVAVRSTRRS